MALLINWEEHKMNFIKNIKSAFQTTDKIIWMDITKILIDQELEGIFVQKETEIQNISNNMLENQKNNRPAFDSAHPIILAHSKKHPELNNVNADGMTRYKAAKCAGLTKVAVIYKDFANRAELVKFVYEQQLLRRNLNESQVIKSWEALNRLTDENGKKAKSDTEIAEELHISRRTGAKIKEVAKKRPVLMEQVKSGELTINKAYTQIKQNEAKAENSAVPSVESTLKEAAEKSAEKSKITTKNNPAYFKGYVAGWQYVYDSFRFGKSPKDLQSELAELETGSKSIKELQKSLLILKESYEQKQAE